MPRDNAAAIQPAPPCRPCDELAQPIVWPLKERPPKNRTNGQARGGNDARDNAAAIRRQHLPTLYELALCQFYGWPFGRTLPFIGA